MTTVVINMKEQTVTTDSRTTTYDTSSNVSYYSVKQKQRIVGDVLIVGTGDRTLIDQFVDAYATDKLCITTNDKHGTTIVVVTTVGASMQADIYTCGNSHKRGKFPFRKTKWGFNLMSVTDINRVIHLGSGSEYARAATYLGSDAIGAVQTAIALDPYSGGPIEQYKFNSEGTPTRVLD